VEGFRYRNVPSNAEGAPVDRIADEGTILLDTLAYDPANQPKGLLRLLLPAPDREAAVPVPSQRGIALDLNIVSDERSRDVQFAPELLDAMSKAGFTSGADWPLPDPVHFEFIPPGADTPD
jgi:hypothetical protein